MKLSLLLAILAFAIVGCASTPDLIRGDQAGAVSVPAESGLGKDLVSAAYNLDNALAVGALLPDDPAPKCVHSVLISSGIEVPAGAEPAKSFVPKQDGFISAGAIAYVIAQQAKRQVNRGVTVDVNCEALLGRVVMDGAAALGKAAPIALGFPGIKAFNTAAPAIIQAAPRLLH